MIASDTAIRAIENTTVPRGRGATIVLWVAQIALAAMFLAAGGSKLAGAPAMVDLFAAIGFGQWFRYVTGVVEIIAAVALLIPSAASLGAVLLVATMLGAVIANLSLGQPPTVPLVLGIVAAAVAWTRRNQLKGLFSRLRKSLRFVNATVHRRSAESLSRERTHIQMTANEAAVRKAYQVAEDKDVPGWVNCFTAQGTFTDNSIGVTYRGQELGRTVETYGTAFPDMHRELYRLYEAGDTVVVELALQGTQRGPLVLPSGTIPPSGKRMDAPCCDVFRIKDGKIESFNCYPSGTIILGQLGALPSPNRG